MNNARRKQLDEIETELQDLKERFETIKEDEEEYLNNIPENLQGSERYEVAEEACDALGEALDYFDEIIFNIGTARGR